MSQNFLPNNDPDLQLARQVNSSIEDEQPLSSIENPLVQALLKYKEIVSQRAEEHPVNPDTIWKRIEQQTNPSSRKPVKRIFSIHTTTKWAVAASVIIAILIGISYFNSLRGPQLIAQSSTTNKTVQLEDGSKVILRPHSKLFALKRDIQAERYRLQGEGYFKVTHDPKRIFSVETPNGKVSVLGTRFILSSWGNRMQVYLEEGSVKVEAATRDSTVILGPGESTSVNTKGNISPVKHSKPSQFTDWLNKQLIFKSKPAKLIVQELEQQFDISISLPGPTSKIKLSGALSLENLNTSLNDLGLVMGGKFIKKGNRSYVFKPN